MPGFTEETVRFDSLVCLNDCIFEFIKNYIFQKWNWVRIEYNNAFWILDFSSHLICEQGSILVCDIVELRMVVVLVGENYCIFLVHWLQI